MSRGPPPTPTALKILRGNPGKRALPKHEPKTSGEAVKPKTLSEAKDHSLEARASLVWDEYAPRYITMGTLTREDEPTFERWCLLKAKLDSDGIDRFPVGLHSVMRSLEAGFGMDPGARARLGGATSKPKNNPFANLA